MLLFRRKGYYSDYVNIYVYVSFNVSIIYYIIMYNGQVFHKRPGHFIQCQLLFRQCIGSKVDIILSVSFNACPLS